MSKLLTLAEVADRTRLSRSTIYSLMKKGKFPKPMKLGERVNFWKESGIEAWIDERAEAGSAS